MALIKSKPTNFSSQTTPDDFATYWAIHTVENDFPRQYCNVVVKGWASKQAYLDKAANKMAVEFRWMDESYPSVPGVEICPSLIYQKIITEPGWEDAVIDTDPNVWA